MSSLLGNVPPGLQKLLHTRTFKQTEWRVGLAYSCGSRPRVNPPRTKLTATTKPTLNNNNNNNPTLKTS